MYDDCNFFSSAYSMTMDAYHVELFDVRGTNQPLATLYNFSSN